MVVPAVLGSVVSKAIAPKPKGISSEEKNLMQTQKRSAQARDKSLSDQIRSRLGSAGGGTESSLLFGSLTGVPQKKTLGP